MPSAILEIRDVSCALGGRPVLRHIDLTVEEGETVVLLGRSGSGKTTLLKTVNGLVPASSGEIRFEGRAAVQWDAVAMRRRMGYVIQDAGLFPHWTVEANIGLVPRLEKWEPARIASRHGGLCPAIQAKTPTAGRRTGNRVGRIPFQTGGSLAALKHVDEKAF